MTSEIARPKKDNRPGGPVSSEHHGTYTPPSKLPLGMRGTVVSHSESSQTLRDRHAVRGCTYRDAGRLFDLTGGSKDFQEYTPKVRPWLRQEHTP